MFDITSLLTATHSECAIANKIYETMSNNKVILDQDEKNLISAFA